MARVGLWLCARLRAGGLCVWAVRAAGGGRRGAPQAQRAPLGMRLSQGSGESDGVKAGRVSSDRKRGGRILLCV